VQFHVVDLGTWVLEGSWDSVKASPSKCCGVLRCC